MSTSLISHNADLAALVQAGYKVQVYDGYLVVKDIPYLTAEGEIRKGDIVTSLELAGNETRPPTDHTVWWSGGIPHTADGDSMEQHLSISRWEPARELGEGINVCMHWSRKPKKPGGGNRGYTDYQEKINTYVTEICGEAEAKFPGVLEAARSGEDPEEVLESRFKYIDTNTYRNGTRGIEKRIHDEVVAVIGIGGSGSYLVDILAKTNVKELHLFDDDVMHQHNAFRLPGAARLEELGGAITKAEWHRKQYAPVREMGVHIHPERIDAATAHRLSACTMVFIAVDDLDVRRRIQAACNDLGIAHIAVGIGVEVEGESNDALGGMVKIERLYVPLPKQMRVARENADDGDQVAQVYGNIQTAELNMLSAALAIVEWKAMRGFYRNDRADSIDSVIYVVSGGDIRLAQKGMAKAK